MSGLASFLVVRAGAGRVGLELHDLVEVCDPGAVEPVPAREPALRGVTRRRGGLIPVVHLGALLAGSAPPADRGEALVVARVGGREVGLEVEAAELVSREPALAAETRAGALPWAHAVVPHAGGYLPLLDLAALAVRLKEAGR